MLPIPARQATRWARDLDLPRGGETVLYTGLMYQLIPYIERLVAIEQRLGNTPLARLTGLGRRLNRFVNGVAFVARPSARERAEYDRIPANVARLLQRAGVQFGYLYEDDLYAGALTHDLGADDVVAVHARRVVALLRRHGVREVITIDPHTTNMLRSVYPKLVDGYDIRVRSYLEVLAERGVPVEAPPSGKVVIHDPCVYARYENVIEPPRKLLAAAGVEVGGAGEARACSPGAAAARSRPSIPAKAAAVAAVPGRTAARDRPGLRDDVPDLPGQPPQVRRRIMRFRDISDYLVEASAPLPDGGRAGERRAPDPGMLAPLAPN